MRPIRAALAVPLACAVALLGACSDDEPEAPPTSTASSSPSISETTETTPAPTPPSLPPEATTPDAAGAAAFVRHWFNLANYAYATGDTTALSTLAHPDCGNCAGLIAAVEAQREAGGTFDGGVVTVQTAEAGAVDTAGLSFVSVVIDQTELRQLDPDGAVGASAPGSTGELLDFYGQFLDGAWKTFGFAPHEEEAS